MATAEQRRAAKRNVEKAQAGAREQQTLEHLPKGTRSAMFAKRTRNASAQPKHALGKEAAAVRRGDSPTRDELMAEARRLDVRGRSKMGKADLKRAVARAR